MIFSKLKNDVDETYGAKTSADGKVEKISEYGRSFVHLNWFL